MKIIHLADLHFRRESYDEACASLDVVEANASDADLICIAGDIWDGPIQNTAGSMFPAFVERIRRLADIAPVAMVYGTPSHDTEGSLDVFETLSSKYDITILQPGIKYFLEGGGISIRPEGSRALLFGIPEPSKKWLLANGGATGKDAADAAVRDAMRALLLGLGGLRRQHPDLPCVLLYHGQVSGAKTGTGYQAGSGIAVSRDDLAAVGADYYALGDIHFPQQIPGLPAYYPGKAYAGDWREQGYKFGCNLVEIGGWVPTHNDEIAGVKTDGVFVDRIDFPHAPRIKISCTFAGQGDILVPRDQMVWMEITCTKGEADDINPDVILAYLEHGGALPGSRVTLNVLPTETVRAGEITEKKALADKVQVWAENSSVVLTATAKDKAREMESEAAARSGLVSGAHIRVTRLRLRGAKGLWKNTKRDEVDLDLEALGPGVLALVGENGSGKTTLIENLHPWPCLLTRDGTLKDHFRLRDSCRELYFLDERTGYKYRALITINAATASGAAEYFLFRDTGAGEEPFDGTNGRKEPYEAAIAQLWGSLEMFLRTAFVSQRASKYAPELQDATKGERKALFAELSGIDYLDAYRATAKGKADAIDEEKKRLDWTVDQGAGIEGAITAAELSAMTADGRAKGKADEAALLEVSGKALAAEREVIAQRVAELDRKTAKRTELERGIARLLAEVKAAEDSIVVFQLAAKGRGAAEAELARIAELEGKAKALREEKAEIDRENHAALVAYQGVVQGIRAQQDAARRDVDARRRELAENEKLLAVAKARISAPIVDHCPTCGQLLPEDRRAHLESERVKAKSEVEMLEAIHVVRVENLADAEKAVAGITLPAQPEAKLFAGASTLAGLEADLAFLDADSARAIIRKADEAAVRIEAAGKVADDARSRVARDRLEVQALEAEKDDGAQLALEDKDRELERARSAYTAAKEAAATARAEGDAARKLRADLEAKLAERIAAENARGKLAGELADWRLLEKACGPDGIQALELDALAPSIAAIANRLLSEAYGSRFTVEFRTTRIGGKGSKTKQIEDFLIYVVDNENGEEQEIATLSGGEAVWIKRAIYDAFATIRAQNIGTKFLVCIQDEADGALDPAARMKYLRMLEAAHEASGRYQTILISHSTEIQAMVQGTIRMEELGA